MEAKINQIGQLIRDARASRGLSQDALAERAGISQPSLSQIETGDTTPRLETLDAIADALGMTAEIRLIRRKIRKSA